MLVIFCCWKRCIEIPKMPLHMLESFPINCLMPMVLLLKFSVTNWRSHWALEVPAGGSICLMRSSNAISWCKTVEINIRNSKAYMWSKAYQNTGSAFWPNLHTFLCAGIDVRTKGFLPKIQRWAPLPLRHVKFLSGRLGGTLKVIIFAVLSYFVKVFLLSRTPEGSFRQEPQNELGV